MEGEFVGPSGGCLGGGITATGAIVMGADGSRCQWRQFESYWCIICWYMIGWAPAAAAAIDASWFPSCPFLLAFA